MQNKTLLKKLVGLTAVVCLALAMVFGLVGCGESEPTVKQTSVQGNKIVVELTDGTKTEYSIDGITDVKTAENGKVVLTYANGSKVTMNYGACSNHDFTSSATVRPASCSEEGVAIKVCKNCGFVESVDLPKDPDVHGKWVFATDIFEGDLEREETDNGIVNYTREDYGYSYYALETQYVASSMTTLEEYSGVAEKCFEAECALCGETFAAGHKPVDEWISVPMDDTTVNVCTDEHLVVKTCPTCKAVFLYDDGTYGYNKTNKLAVESEPALGHLYGAPVVGAKVTNSDPNYYPVTLHCTRCGEDQDVRAYFKQEVKQTANCKDDGFEYKIYEYEYWNYENGESKKFTDTISVERVDYPSTGEHAVTEDIVFFAYEIGEADGYAYTEDLKPLFDNGTLRWNEGEPATCSNYAAAVFTCISCNEVIVISVSGEHTFGAEAKVSATCTEDGYSYKTCTVCGYEWVYGEVPAAGHNYQYVANSFAPSATAANAGTAQVKCAVCGDTLVLDATLVDTYTAQNCGEKSYKEYKVTVDNGLGTSKDIKFKVYDPNEIIKHTIKGVDGFSFAAYQIGNQGGYEYNDKIDAAFTNGDIRWNEGTPATCSDYAAAVFDCTVCKQAIVISLSGKHTLSTDEADKETVDPTCTEKGYVAVRCTACDNYIVQSTIDAKGHTFAPVADNYAAFTANPIDGAEIPFRCACGEEIILKAKKTSTNSTAGCTTTDTDTYEFLYNGADYKYYVQKATDEGNEKTLEKTYKAPAYVVAVTTGSHLLGSDDNGEVRVVAFNLYAPNDNKYEYNTLYDFGKFFDNGELRWNEGEPASCTSYALAVFTCKVCNERVVIQLSGEHTFNDDENNIDVVDPDCENDGFTVQRCIVCGQWFITDEEDALGHDYGEWTIEGDLFAEAYVLNGEVVIDQQTLELGYAISICQSCQDELIANARIIKTELPTCGKDGKITVAYRFDGVDVAQTTITVARLPEHITDIEDAESVVKAYDKEKGEYILAYYCEDCGQFVVAYRGTETYINSIITEVLGIENVNVIG